VSEVINVYCDESCHLEHDHQAVMVLGALWCPRDRSRVVAERMREIKDRHGLAKNYEVKWTKISVAKRQFFIDLVDYFFDNEDLHFRALIVPDKSRLRHAEFGQTHDDWYYKMYFDLLKVIIDPHLRYHIYLDLKDTRGKAKVKKLHEVLANEHYDFSRQIIERIQTVRSHEVELLQLADLLIGAISYVNRGLHSNAGKLAVLERIRGRSHYALTQTTLLKEDKVNLFRWHAAEAVS
jgi:hypothetical protein